MSSNFIKTVFFDFDGVLSKDYFYTNLKDVYPEVYRFIQKTVFGKQSKMPDKWMRGELTSNEVNRFISINTGLDFTKLSKLFIESVKAMRIEKPLVDLAVSLKDNLFQTALITNNMDVFDKITKHRHQLDSTFPVIVNSFNYGVLKHEENGKLFDIAMYKLKIRDYKNALLIDNSAKARKMFEQKGGSTFAYTDYPSFKKWADKKWCQVYFPQETKKCRQEIK